jgi:Mg-chelatase subunit ChlD
MNMPGIAAMPMSRVFPGENMSPNAIQLARQARTVIGALPLVAKAIGRDLGVNVVVGGDQASTNGKSIVIPALPTDDPDMPKLAYGYIDHEAAHVRFSDFELLKDGTLKTPLHKHLTNILEDVRIERQIMRMYPGTRRNLDAVVSWLVDQGHVEAANASDKPALRLTRYLTNRLNLEELGRTALADHARLSEAAMRSTMPPGLMTKLDGLLSQVPLLGSTREAAILAGKILTMIDEESELPEEEKPGDDGDPALGAAGQPASDGTSGNDAGQAGPSAEATPLTPEQSEMLKDLLRDDGKGLDSGVGEKVAEIIGEKVRVSGSSSSYGGNAGGVGEPEPLQLVRHDVTELLREVRLASSVLRRKLSSVLDSSHDEERWHDTSGALLDSDEICRVPLGDHRVFLREEQAPATATAVQVILDRSYSMSSRMELAVRAVLAVALGLEQVPGVSVATSVFPGNQSENGIVQLTRFGESVKRSAPYYPSVYARGGTPMAEAIYYAVDQLLMQREPRRLILVLTDGAPHNSQACATAVNAARALGVECYGIGINTMCVEKLFPSSVVVNDVNELASAMFGMLQTALVKKAA